MIRLSSTESGAARTVRGQDGRPGLEIEIAMGPQGPIARLKTAAIQIEMSRDVDARWEGALGDSSGNPLGIDKLWALEFGLGAAGFQGDEPWERGSWASLRGRRGYKNAQSRPITHRD